MNPIAGRLGKGNIRLPLIEIILGGPGGASLGFLPTIFIATVSCRKVSPDGLPMLVESVTSAGAAIMRTMSSYQAIDAAETAGLSSIVVNGNVFSPQCLDDTVAHYLDFELMLTVVVEEQRFCAARYFNSSRNSS